jgi:hypothetical protein
LRLRRKLSGRFLSARNRSALACVAHFAFLCIALAPGASRADECDAIEDPHAFNLCLAAHGPVYRPKNTHGSHPLSPEDYQSETEQGMAAAPKESFTPTPARPAAPRYSPFLNLRTARSGGSARANPFSLLPDMKRRLNGTLSAGPGQGGEQMVSPGGLGSGRLP